jgi:hypothetical protein
VPHPLDSAQAKLERAEHHFQTLDAEAVAHFVPGAYPSIHEFDRQSGNHRYTITLEKPLPPHWPLLIGDCVHNARAALDHLAWHLAGAKANDTTTQFPIFADPAKFNPRHVKAIPEQPRALIEGLQPHRRAHPLNDPLWTLQVLDAEDKHKNVSLALAAVSELIFEPVVPALSRVHHELQLLVGPWDPAEGHAVFAEGPIVAYPLGGGPPNPDVEMDLYPTLDIAIRAEVAGATYLPGRVVLREVLDCVSRVLGMFERFF